MSRPLPRTFRALLAAAAAAIAAALAAAGITDAATAPHTTYPLTIRNCGKTLTFAKAPSRAVSDQAQDTTPFFELGIQDRLVAIFSHTGSDLAFMGVEPKITLRRWTPSGRTI